MRSAAAGHVPLDPRVAGVLLPDSGGRPEDAMSPRELEVLRLVAQGLANKQIGRRLGISERTVKAHLGRVFRQLGVADRTSAALWAHDHLPDRVVGRSGSVEPGHEDRRAGREHAADPAPPAPGAVVVGRPLRLVQVGEPEAARASAPTQSPRVRWCSTYLVSPVTSSTSTYGVRSQ